MKPKPLFDFQAEQEEEELVASLLNFLFWFIHLVSSHEVNFPQSQLNLHVVRWSLWQFKAGWQVDSKVLSCFIDAHGRSVVQGFHSALVEKTQLVL